MSAQKQKGTAYETLVLEYVKGFRPFAERMPQQGANDKGDLYIPGETRFALELKNVARMDLSGWLAEAAAEAKNANALHGIVVHKRKGKGQAPDQYVTMTLRTFCELAWGR